MNIRLQILIQISFFTMDKLTKNYIDDFVRPLIYRIQYLQRSNEQLKVQVKYLQSIVLDKTYQKPTVSAANHMRDSRISSKNQSSVEKKPTWNSKTKVQQSPTNNKEPIAHEKLKTKPPIPKSVRSPNKNEGEDLRSSSFQKRILGGTKLQTQASQKKLQQDDQQPSPKKTETPNKKPNQQQSQSPSIPSQKKPKAPQLDVLNNKFTQLVKNNNEILSSMKQNNQEARESIVHKGNSPNNYVQKAMAPKSQQHSQTASPNERSFISQQHPQKPAANLKINLDGNMVQVDIK